eukprot:COSAG04_NODE_10748_length_756_cov_0.761035_2_plen_219_part_01
MRLTAAASGASLAVGRDGVVRVTAGSVSNSSNGAAVSVSGGSSTAGVGGSVAISGGDDAGAGTGGNVVLQGGASATGATGKVQLKDGNGTVRVEVDNGGVRATGPAVSMMTGSESCVATDAAVCAAVQLNGSAARCTSAGACSWSAANASAGTAEACVASAFAVCAGVPLNNNSTACTSAGACTYTPVAAVVLSSDGSASMRTGDGSVAVSAAGAGNAL